MNLPARGTFLDEPGSSDVSSDQTGRLPITGILETCLYVEDVPRSREFYQRLFGFEALLADERIATLAVVPGQVLILFKRGATTVPAP